MDVEHVIFSAGQRGAADGYNMVKLKRWVAHLVFFDDMRPATVFTSDTPPRLRKCHKTEIEVAVAEAGRDRFVQELAPQYGMRYSRELGSYFLAMAQDALGNAAAQAASPVLSSGQVVV